MPLSTVHIHDTVAFPPPRLVDEVSVVRVDVVVGELARRHLALEHDVHLLEGTVLRLWQAEEAPECGEQRQTAPEKGLHENKSVPMNRIYRVWTRVETYSLSLSIPCSGGHEVRLQNTTNDVGNVVRAAAQDDGLGSETGGANLSDDRVDDGADRHGVNAEPDDTEDRLDQAESVGLGLDAGQDADEPQAAQQAVEAAEPDAPPSPLGDVEPRDYDAAEGDGGADETQAVGEVGA